MMGGERDQEFGANTEQPFGCWPKLSGDDAPVDPAVTLGQVEASLVRIGAQIL